MRKQCQRLLTERVISLPYGKTSTNFAENVSVFVLWMIGLGLSLGVWVAEMFGGEGGSKMAEKYPKRWKLAAFVLEEADDREIESVENLIRELKMKRG